MTATTACGQTVDVAVQNDARSWSSELLLLLMRQTQVCRTHSAVSDTFGPVRQIGDVCVVIGQVVSAMALSIGSEGRYRMRRG